MYQLNPLLSLLETKKYSKEDRKRALLTTGSIGAGLTGAGLIKNSTDRINGTVTRFHNTSKGNVASILDQGILAKFADDPNNITNQVLRDVDPSKKTGLVYTAKNRRFANSVGAQRYRMTHPFEAMAGLPVPPNKTGKNLKLKFRYDDIKRMERIINPELRGATNPKDFLAQLVERYKNSPGQLRDVQRTFGGTDYSKLSAINKLKVKQAFNDLHNNTHIFRGDISPEHIVGSKHYKPQTNWTYWKQYVKNNPKRFAKGVAGAAAGTAALGAAGYMGYKALKKKKKKES